MTSKLMRFLCMVMLMALVLPASAFKDFKVDLTNKALLTEEEYASGASAFSFGIVVGEDGSVTRVAANDPTADVVLNGKYHSDEHGWGNFSATFAVDGPVKVSMGTCDWGGDVTIKNAAGEAVGTFNTDNGTCFHGNKAENIASGNYSGEATTLTVSGGNYTPYFAVETLSEVPAEANVTYAAGDYTFQGKLPAAVKVEVGQEVVIPANFTMYIDGKTLTGWSDGTNVYAAGDKLTPAADVELTPVFTDNTVALKDRTDAVNIRWDFQRRNGAPTVGYQGTEEIWVAQATVNGEVIDVLMNVDTRAGKMANANWNDWAQLNGGTILTVPSCKGANVTMESNSPTTTTTVDGLTINAEGNTFSVEVGSDAETIDVVIGDGSYWRYLALMLPYVKPDLSGTTFTAEPATVVWPMQDQENPAKYTAAPEGSFSTVAFDLGTASITGTGTGQAKYDDGSTVTFLKIKPKNGASDVVEWNLKPAKGLTFTPTKVSAYIARFGTDAENGITVTAKKADGATVELGNFTAPRNNKAQADDKYGKSSNYTNRFEIELTAAQQEQLKGADGLSFYGTIGVGNSKEGGYAQMTVEGLLDGTIEAVEKFTVEAVASPAEGGSVVVYPKSDTYDNGTSVKLTATKNFGYSFVNWTDAAGQVLSEEPEFNYTVTANSVLTANFNKLNTYELAMGVDGGANAYMVVPTPKPNVVDGKNMYEEGTKVTLKAISNPILTFTNWNDGQSSSEITVDMTEDKEYIASYSAIDYVVGWDFYKSGTGRAADFVSPDNDNVVLTMRNAEGNSEGWLDKSEEAAGGYEGRPGATNWRTYGLGEYYWQTKVNAGAFKNLKLITAMVYNYNAYTTYNVEYSLDGENWTKAGVVKMEGAKNWADAEINFPETVNNKTELYIRWIADKTSTVDGTSSNNDGATLGASYLIGDKELVNDGVAPVLVSVIPAEGSNTASINGKVVLTYDEKVKVKEGTKATLGELELTPTVTGKTVIFEYKNLAYATDYRFNLAANTVADLTDNYSDKAVTINFTTKTRPEVAKGMYDFIVPDNGKLEDAFAAAAKRDDDTKRFRIFVKNGTYVLPASTTATKEGSDKKTYPDPTTYLSTPNVSIIGESIDGVVITNTATTVLEGIGKGDVLQLKSGATNYYLQNLTLKSNIGDGKGRDIVLNDQSNKTIAKDICLWAYQDTYVSNNDKGRYYFEGGVLRGRTDYLCGKGDVFYNEVTLRMIAGGYLVAPSNALEYGYVFNNCEIVADAEGVDGNFTLGRPWGKGVPTCYWLNTIMSAKPSAIGWNEMSGGWPNRFAEYNSMTATGTVIDLAQRKKEFGDDGDKHANNPVLTKAEADAITYSAVMGRDDDWDPASLAEQAPEAVDVEINGTQLTWKDNNYTLLWAIVKNNKVVDFVTTPEYTVDDANATYAVRAANEMGGLGAPVLAVEGNQSGIDAVDAADAIVRTAYYNVEGMEVSADYHGIVIKVDTLANGTTVATKIVNK